MRAELALIERSLESLPVFPLPSAVLLPYEVLPLHIFEPRYREMIRDVVDAGGALAIANLAPGWESDYEGRPGLDPICGVGVVVRHDKLEDGRSNILLRGVARARIVGEEPPRHSYRRVRATLLPDTLPAGGDAALVDLTDGVRRLLFDLCAGRPGPGSAALAQLASRTDSASALADVVCAALVTDPDRRFEALRAVDVVRRLELAELVLAETLAEAAGDTPGLRN